MCQHTGGVEGGGGLYDDDDSDDVDDDDDDDESFLFGVCLQSVSSFSSLPSKSAVNPVLAIDMNVPICCRTPIGLSWDEPSLYLNQIKSPLVPFVDLQPPLKDVKLSTG